MRYRVAVLCILCFMFIVGCKSRDGQTTTNGEFGYGKVVDVQYSPSNPRLFAPETPDYYVVVLDTEDGVYICNLYVDDLTYLPHKDEWVKFKYPDFDGIGGSIYCSEFEEK